MILNLTRNRYFFCKISFIWLVGSTGTSFIHGSSFLTNTSRYLTWDRISFASLAYLSVNSLVCLHFHNLLSWDVWDICLHADPFPTAQIGFNSYKLNNNCRWLLFSISRDSSWHIHFRLYPHSLSQFQPKLAQSILRLREFKFVQINNHTLFQRGIITK